MEFIGSLIRKDRKQAGLTQEELVRVLPGRRKRDRSWLSVVEKGRVIPRESMVRDIALALHKEPSYYLAARQFSLHNKGAADKRLSQRASCDFKWCLAGAERVVKYRGFSGVSLLTSLTCDLERWGDEDLNEREFVQALDKGLVIRVVLAEPTLDNLYQRASAAWDHMKVEGLVQRHVERSSFLEIHMGTIMAECWLFYRTMRVVHSLQSGLGILDVRLDPEYAPQSILIIDNECGFAGSDLSAYGMTDPHWWSDTHFFVKGQSSFSAAVVDFSVAGKRSRLLDLTREPSDGQPWALPTGSEIRSFLELKARK